MPKSAGSVGVPHVLARLPDLRPARQQPVEPARQQPVEPPASTYTQPSQPAPTVQARPVLPPAFPAVAREIEELTNGPTSEFFEPQVLPSIERVWQTGRDWLSKHAKVAMVVVAMMASHGMLLMWRHAPAEHEQGLQPLGDTLDSSAEETAQLNPIPMEGDAASSSREEGPRFVDTPAVDEPHLALPRPEPDPISMTAPPRLGVHEDPTAQPKLAAAADGWPNEARPAEQEQMSDSRRRAAGGSSGEGAGAKDVPPWESWSDEKSSTPTAAPAAEAAAQVAPRLSPPDGSGGMHMAPDEARTASLSADRPSSRAGSAQRPRSVAKLKGTINKSLAEPAHEHVRRSLY